MRSLTHRQVWKSFPLTTRCGASLTAANDGANVDDERATREHSPTCVEGIVYCIFLGMIVLAAGSASAQGTDASVARSIAATCANCHGTNGVSQGGTESLAGQSKEDIVRKMQEFKSGTKPGTIMPQLAKGYTDAQIEQAAGWFAAQKLVK